MSINSPNLIQQHKFKFKTRTKSCPSERKLGLKEILRRNYHRKL